MIASKSNPSRFKESKCLRLESPPFLILDKQERTTILTIKTFYESTGNLFTQGNQDAKDAMSISLHENGLPSNSQKKRKKNTIPYPLEKESPDLDWKANLKQKIESFLSGLPEGSVEFEDDLIEIIHKSQQDLRNK